MKHNCCSGAEWYLKYDRDGKFWYILSQNTSRQNRVVNIGYCPFCGEKLPIPKRHQAAIGDYVVKTKKGELRLLPRKANGYDGIQYAEITDILIGVLSELAENFEDHWILPQVNLQWPYKRVKIRVVRDLIINGHL